MGVFVVSVSALIQEQTPSYLPSYTRLGHAIPGSKTVSVGGARHLPKHTGPSYKPYCMPSLTVALLLLEWLHDGVYAGRSVGSCDTGSRARNTNTTPHNTFNR